jgi:hypothetical protein
MIDDQTINFDDVQGFYDEAETMLIEKPRTKPKQKQKKRYVIIKEIDE